MGFQRAEIKAASMLKDVTKRYNQELSEAKEKGIPVAWVTAVSPVEIMRAMDIFPYYPENYGTIAGAKKMTSMLAEVAESHDYPVDMCAYAKAGLGAFCLKETGKENPVGELAHPDLIIPSNSQCISLFKWFAMMGKQLQVPYFCTDYPLVYDELTPKIKNYLIEQLQEMVAFLEETTGKKLDYDRLREVLALSNQACSLWNDVLDMGALLPSRFNFFDACIHMAPIVNWRGTQVAVDYYKVLKEELQQREQQGIQSVPGEKYRLYWDHIPIWSNLRFFSDYFGEHKTAVLCSLYTHSWTYHFDTTSPLETLVENYASVFVNRGFERRVELKRNLMKRYSVDGFIFNLNRSCKPNSLALYDKRRIISEQEGLPGLIFEADMCDTRFIDENNIKRQLDTFMEQLENSKK